MLKNPVAKPIVNKVTRKDVNIFKHPQEIIPFIADPVLPTHLIYGDLHGNFMNGLHWLVKQDVITINSEIYEELGVIYEEHANAIRELLNDEDADKKKLKIEIADQIADFEALLEQVAIKNKPILKWGGDEKSDRGASDLFTAQLFHLLHKSKITSEIPISNHTLEFLFSFEMFKQNKDPASFVAHVIKVEQTVSMLSLYALLIYDIIDAEKIIDLVDNYFKPCLKVFTYVIDPKSLAISNHAFVGLEAIEWFADYYQLPFYSKSHLGICLTIDLINEKLSESVRDGTLFDREFLQCYAGKNFSEEKSHPLLYVTWYRANVDEFIETVSPNITIPEYIGGKKTYYIHGHNGMGIVPKSISSYVINLDSEFGRPQEHQHHFGDDVYNAVIAYGHSTGYILKMYRELELIIQNAANALPKNCESSFLQTPSQLGANVLATKKVQAKMTLVSDILQQLSSSSSITLNTEQVKLLKEGDLMHIFENHNVLPGVAMNVKLIKPFLKKKLEQYLESRKEILEKLAKQYKELLFDTVLNYTVVDKIKTIVIDRIEGNVENKIEFSADEKAAISKNEELVIFINNYKEFFFNEYLDELINQASATKCVIA